MYGLVSPSKLSAASKSNTESLIFSDSAFSLSHDKFNNENDKIKESNITDIFAENKGYRAYVRFWNLIYPFRLIARHLRIFVYKVLVKLHFKPKWSPFRYDY